MKWCGGPCGRFLPLSVFKHNGKIGPGGRRYYQSYCKDCHRVSERGRYRIRMRRTGALVKRRLRERTNYATNPARAERKKAGARAYYWRQKAMIEQAAATSIPLGGDVESTVLGKERASDLSVSAPCSVVSPMAHPAAC